MKIVLFIIFGLILFFAGCKTKYATTTDTVLLPPNTSFEHGKILTFSICGQCHYNPVTNSFIGRRLTDVPGFVGKVYSHNITSDIKKGIGTYTDAELFYLIKTGVARNGKLVPYMLRPNIADADLKAIILYLSSNDIPVRGNDTIVGITKYTLIGKIGINATKPLPYKTGISAPEPGDKVIYGKYLVDQIGCYHCHSKSLLKLNYLKPEKSKGYMRGGMAAETPEGKKIFASNLTPDDETGIGKYTESEFAKVVKDGIARDGRKMQNPMPQFHYLTNEQVSALFAYLKSLQPVKHKVKVVKK
jgi:hypothetical protein